MTVAQERHAQWLVPPRLLTTSETDNRHATWLELFFDVVFVVAITELSRQLVLDHSAAGFLRFAALFAPVYVAWQGYMAYATRFDTDDVAFRAAYLAGMLAIAAMATLIGDVARGVHSAGFAVSYVCLRSIVVALYWRAWRSVPEARRDRDRGRGTSWRVQSASAATLGFAGCAVVISHDRWFHDRVATHMLAFEGDSKVTWFEGNYQDYEAWRKKQLGAEADQPHRIKYKKLMHG